VKTKRVTVGDTFEDLIAEGKINFRKAKLAELCDWGQQCMAIFFKGYQFELGDKLVGRAYVLKLVSHPLVSYIDILPESQQFLLVSDLGHHDSIHPDELLAWDLASTVDTNVDIDKKTGTSVLRLGNIVIVEPGRDRSQKGPTGKVTAGKPR